QEELAARANLSVRAISDLERGLKRPRRDTLNLLADALALPPHKRAQMEVAVRPASGAGQPAESSALPPHNLPAQLTVLLGRAREAVAGAEVVRGAGVRFGAAAGAGGVGKRRLGLQVAEDALEDFEDGVLLTPLAALRDPGQVVGGICVTLGMLLVPG